MRLPALVQPGVGPEVVEHHPTHRRAASRRPRHQSPDPSAVSRHPQRVSDVGDGDHQWLQEANRPGPAHPGPVLPGAAAPGGCWLLQRFKRRCV